MFARATLVAIVAAFVATLLAPTASAYCRASTCAEGQLCGPPPWDDPTCIPLAWKRPCVGYSLTAAASADVPLDAAESIVKASFEAWETASCDELATTHPSIHVVDTGPVGCDLVEYNSAGGNANIIAFRDIAWPHPTGPHNIALTTVTYDNKTGEIYDADMEINTASFDFTMADDNVQTDLLSVMTHEAGHFLGLAHSEIPDATMWANYTPGTVDARSLSPDDITLVCTTYEPTSEPVDPATCNPIPRHGFSEACLSNQTEGDCSVKRPAALGHGGPGFAALLVLGCAALRRRRLKDQTARQHP